MSKTFKEKDFQGALDVLADRKLDKVEKMACRDLQELLNTTVLNPIPHIRHIYYQSEDIEKVVKLAEKLEKALDKAIDIIMSFDSECCCNCPMSFIDENNKTICALTNTTANKTCTKEQWKEWLLK